MIHAFRFHDYNLILDVESGALHSVDEPAFAVVQALEKGWAKGWRKRGWKKADKKPALNPDLWARLLDLCDYHKVNLHWVKGHAANPYNNRCDELAVAESRNHKQ